MRIIKTFPLPILGYLLLLVLFTTCQSPAIEDSQQPNVLLIMTDDQGWGDLSFHGNPDVETPNIDHLALESVRFTRFYVSPVCAPTRASLLTGRYHLRTGTSWVTHRKEVMRSKEITLAEYLKEQNYQTGLFGKWHNGHQYPNDPEGQGFDQFIGFKAGHWNNYFDTNLESNQDTIASKGYITDVLTDYALQFIEDHKDHPFFCYVPFNAPHSPFQVPEIYFEKYKNKGLEDKLAAVYGMCENIDDNVGRLLLKLQELEIDDHTIIIFLTDNGPNGQRFNGGMKGIKASVHEGGVRVPFFMKWGKEFKPREITDLAAHIDILPTLLDLLDIPQNTDYPVDGRSLVPLLKEEKKKASPRAIFNIHTEGENRAYPISIRTDRYRLAIEFDQTPQLYDMVKDPAQTTNLADSNISVRDSLMSLMEAWFAEVSQNSFDVPAIPVGFEGIESTILPAPEATIKGELQFKGGRGWSNDWITNWGNNLDTSSWDIQVQKTGQYDLQLSYNLKGAADGITGLQILWDKGILEVDHLPAFWVKPYASPDRIPRGEVYEKEWKTLEIGRIQLKSGSNFIKLVPKKIADGAELEIKSITLVNNQ